MRAGEVLGILIAAGALVAAGVFGRAMGHVLGEAEQWERLPEAGASSAIWLGDAGSSTTFNVLSSEPTAVVFSIGARERLRLDADGGAWVDGVPVKGKQEIYDGLAKWMRGEWARCPALAPDAGGPLP